MQVVEPVVQAQVANATVTTRLLIVPADADVELKVASNTPVILNVEALDISFGLSNQFEVTNASRRTNEERIVQSFRCRDRGRGRIQCVTGRQSASRCRCLQDRDRSCARAGDNGAAGRTNRKV